MANSISTPVFLCGLIVLSTACTSADSTTTAPADDTADAVGNDSDIKDLVDLGQPELDAVGDTAGPDIAELDAAYGFDSVDTPSPDVGGPAFNVLFIGNSYTYVNDLPAMVDSFATSGGAAVEVDSVTQGGATFYALLGLPGVTDALAKTGWTHVVLQGQSLEPVFDPESFAGGAKALSDKAAPTGAALAFYTTWPRKPGDAIYQEPLTGGTPEALAAGLQAAYQKAADDNGGVRVKVGDAWMRILAEYPEISLYQADGSHPVDAGTYLAACVFSATLLGVDPSSVTWHPTGVSDADATTLRAVCGEVVAASSDLP